MKDIITQIFNITFKILATALYAISKFTEHLLAGLNENIKQYISK